jgi:GPH family glycoside/pentoside/hexuronide:cation symporter
MKTSAANNNGETAKPASSRSHETASEDRVPIPKKAAYGSGMIAYSLLVNGYAWMVNPIFNVNLGLSPILIGWVTAIGRVWDSFTDPFMASVSDNTRSRWGRRRPWIALGSVIAAVLFVLIWWFPEGKSDNFYFWWLLITTLMFLVGFTIFSVPYIAMGMEMSPDPHERTRVVAWRQILGPVGAFAAQGLFWFTTLAIFATPIIGMRYTSIGVALLIIAFGLTAAFVPREHSSVAKVVNAQKKVPLLKSAKQTLQVAPFRLTCAITFVNLMSVLLVSKLGFYVNLYHVYDGDQAASAAVFAFAGLAYQLAAIGSVPFITAIANRLGKRRTLMWFLGLAIFGSAIKWWCYTPALPYLQLLPNFIMGFGFTANALITNAMLPENCDCDELKTGTRREGMFGAVYSWTFKLGAAFALLGTGYIIAFSGYDASLGVEQPESAIFWMRFLLAGLPCLGMAIGIYLTWLYPITDERAYEIQDELKARRTALDAEEEAQTTGF